MKITLSKLIASKILIVVLFISATNSIEAQDSTINPTTAANNFTVFTSGNAIAMKTESEAPWAIGGDFVLDGVFNIFGGENFYNGDSNPTGLVVNGKINYVSGTLKILENNHIKIGDLSTSAIFQTDSNNATMNTVITNTGGYYTDDNRIDLAINQATSSISGDSGINFTEAFTQFESISSFIGDLNTNVTWNVGKYNNGKLWVNLTENQVNVINLTSAEFNALSEIKFKTVEPTTTTPFIVNITDLNDSQDVATLINSWPDVVDTALAYAQYILYNFPNIASTINYTGGSQIYGTIYCPKARFNNRSNSNIDGQIIAKEFEQNSGEIHSFRFNALINYSAPVLEVCDGIDNDGDGQIDEGFADTDGDGIADCVDDCPNVANPNPGDCGPPE